MSSAKFDRLLALARRESAAGRLAEAHQAFEEALAVRPDSAEAHNDLGLVFAQKGELAAARRHFVRAVALAPSLAEAHNNLGNIDLMQGAYAAAELRYQQALTLRPGYAEALNCLGISLSRQGKTAAAAARFRDAIAKAPDFADAYNNLGNVLREEGQRAEARAHFERALALRPDFLAARNNLGIVLQDEGDLAAAVRCFEQVVAARPDMPESYLNLGKAFRLQDRLSEAQAVLERALRLRPDYVAAHVNLGTVLQSQGNFDAAAARYEHALKLQPDGAEAENNLGVVRSQQGRPAEAIPHFERALALRPGYVESCWGLAACYLIEENYERGWPAYEQRPIGVPAALPRDIPRWRGESLAGRSLLLVGEQGLGDTIQFIRYARLLKERGARLVLAAQAALLPLLAAQSDLDEVVSIDSAAPFPRCDFHLPLLSLPYVFGTTSTTIPAAVPYLSADAALTAEWRQELARVDGFRIGIAWQGARDFAHDRWRSIPLAHFAPLASIDGVRLVSLQKGFGTEQIAAAGFPVIDVSGLDEAGAFLDTAAMIRNLDLVITSDSAIAHLAGALGAPVWVALGFSPDWRWLREREDSPWYPTLRLFRQTTLGDWPDVFRRMAAALQRLTNKC